MKRKGNFYADIYNKQNIKKAILKASAKKHSRKNVAKIIDNIDYYVNEIHNMLISKNIQLSPYKKMKIFYSYFTIKWKQPLKTLFILLIMNNYVN